MPIFAPFGQFTSYPSNVAAPSVGTAITPGTNTYPAYAQIMATGAVPDDVYGFWINVNAMAVSGVARDARLKLGVDRAGGSSPVDLLVDWGVASAGNLGGVGGIGVWQYLPLFLPRATSFWASASVNNATVGTCNAIIQLSCRPRGPRPPRTGTFVRTFGALTNSAGTPLTPTNGSKGAWVQVGTTAEELWFWGLAVGLNNAAMNNNITMWDLGIGASGSQRIVVADLYVNPSTSETVTWMSPGQMAHASAGEGVWLRAASNGAAVTGFSGYAYGFGG